MPTKWRVLDRETRERLEAERRELILSYPAFTLMRIGWETNPGVVQGGTFYRLGEGLGPTSRDHDAVWTLTQEVMGSHLPWDDQEWGIQILALPFDREIAAKALWETQHPLEDVESGWENAGDDQMVARHDVDAIRWALQRG